MNLLETVQHIGSMAVEAGELEIQRIPGQPHTTIVTRADGTFYELADTPGDRRLECGSLGSLAAMAKDPRFVSDVVGATPACFITPREVILVFNVGNGYERAALPLPWSAEINWMIQRVESPFVEAPALRDTIRYVLGDDGAPLGLLEKISRVDFTAQTRTAASHARTGESIGATVTREARVIGETDDGTDGTMEMPPERQVFSPKMWRNGDLTYRGLLPVVLDPDLTRQGWLIVPREEDLEVYFMAAVAWLRDELRSLLGEREVPIYLGVWSQVGNPPPTGS